MKTTQERIDFLRGLENMKLSEVDIQILRTTVDDLVEDLLASITISTQGVGELLTWYTHESIMWELSESFRTFLRRNRQLRGKNDLLDILSKLAQDARIGKGRQNIVSILGEYGRISYGGVIGSLLSDRDIYGHAIDALYRARVKGYEYQVAQSLEKEKLAWIRNSAKRYLAWCRDESNKYEGENDQR